MRSPYLLVSLALLAGLGYLGARYLSGSGSEEAAPVGGGCDLSQGPCSHPLPDGGSVRMELLPRPVPLMAPVQVRVSVVGSDVVPQRLDITGLNMRMAPNLVSFQPLADGVWRGETIFPVCSQRRMHWQAALTLRARASAWLVKDAFYTVRP